MLCVTGYVIVLPCIDRWVTVDLRTKAFSVPPQMVLSYHRVFCVYYKSFNSKIIIMIYFMYFKNE